MILFNDIFYSEGAFKILTEAKSADGSIMKIYAPFFQSDVENGNGRIYPKDIMQREVTRVQKDIDGGRFLGTSDHPKSGMTELDKVSHIVNTLEIDEKGQGWAELSILDTVAGKNLKVILKSGGSLGLSTRGFGTFDKKTKKVKEDYKLSGLDIVSNPSYQKGVFSSANIFESMNLDLTEKKKPSSSSAAFMKEGHMLKNKLLIEQLNADTQWARVTKMLFENEENFDGTLEKYAEKNGFQIRCVLAVEAGEFETYELAAIKLKGDEQQIADGRRDDHALDENVTEKDLYELAKLTGLSPEKMKETIDKNNAKPGITEKRVLMRKQLVLACPELSPEKIDEAVEKQLANESNSCKPRPIYEAEQKVLDDAKIKPTKRQAIIKEMKHWGAMGGFTQEQTKVAIERRMAQLDEEAK